MGIARSFPLFSKFDPYGVVQKMIPACVLMDHVYMTNCQEMVVNHSFLGKRIFLARLLREIPLYI